MKHLLVLLFFSLSVYSQKNTEAFASTSLNETREISITLPPNYQTNTSKEYPLLVLLDGEYLYDPFYGAISYGTYWDDLPETIIVAIKQGNSDQREKDCGFNPMDGLPTARATAFFNFINYELLPYIDKKYRTAPFRIIAGHDTTAGFLNAFLYKESPIFNAYIALSPELAPETENYVVDKLKNLKQPLFYYQALASGDVNRIKDPVIRLDEKLKKIDSPQLNYKLDQFTASHYAVVLYAIPNALYHIFDVYKPISSVEFSEKIVTLEQGYTDYLVTKYDVITNKLGLKVPVRVNDFKAIEAAILKNKAYGELDQLSQIADKNYPKAMLARYELGLMYEKMGELKKAAKKYQSASQLDPIGGLTKDMMINKYYDLINQKESNGKDKN
ncbi:alpha/beta hydrolase-fold protein [Flavobacterium crassostreae]|uniref:Histidine kinase n=1 Tax=Flavobacterium crassostreae TaxID=1763534 RepID=A0A1B9E0B0_9FLAO|nr:alpha/beta hydrolase-fold protein [Flavobacterium crassostreae]OCB75364.1 histidine kinase [Flavobacterium crassostreae]